MNAFLSIYEFKIAGVIPAYHTEIAIGENSFGFGDEGMEINERQNLNGQFGYRLITSIPLGRTQKSPREIRQIVLRLENEWPADDYDLFRRNCRHFSLALLNELDCDSTAEARRILAGLIFFSEKTGWMISVIMTGLVHLLPLNPLTMVSRPLEIFNEGRILDMNYDFKMQLLQMLVISNAFWILFLFVMSFFSRSDNEENEIIERMENMEL